MPNSFGSRSRQNLDTADAKMQRKAHMVLRIKDHSIIKGHRGKLEQNAAFADGKSKLEWPRGKHNGRPSSAIDVQTYPRPDNDADLRDEQIYLMGLYKATELVDGVPVRTGADWDQDGELSDNTWDDLFHVEINGD